MLDLHEQRLMGRWGWGLRPSLQRLSCSGAVGTARTGWKLREGEGPQGLFLLCLRGPSLTFPTVTGRTAPARLPACLERTLQSQTSSAFKLWVLASHAGAQWPRTQMGMMGRGKEARGAGGLGQDRLRIRSLSLHEKLLCVLCVRCLGRETHQM